MSRVARGERGYRCADCGWESPVHIGRCSGCGAWNRMEAYARPGRAAPGARPAGATPRAVALADAPLDDEARIATSVPELDRVLGGGLVPGELVLVGGDPGIGKSTL